MTDATPPHLPITRVTLYTSGVGYFERTGTLDGTASITLSFPLGQVNDVLKSLVLLDGGDGQLQPVTYAAQDPVARALQAFSVNVGDSPDRATLLDRMRGASVTVTTDDPDPLTGLILSVEAQDIMLGDGRTTERQTLNLLADDGLHAIPLDFLRRLQINDAQLDDELRQALAVVAQGRDADKRPVTITFSGQGSRPVQIGYLAEAPAWQTTYRLVLGGTPLLQGWALVQNTGQDDWSETELSLVSGRPISFIQDLYTPLYVQRPTVQSRIPASPVPQTYAADLSAALAEPDYEDMMPMPPPPMAYGASLAPAPAPAMSMMAGGSVPMRKAAAPGGMDMGQAARQSVATSGAQVGAALFAYHIGVPVSVPRRQSAMIPFVAAPVQIERVSVYNARVQRDHPLSGVRLKNTTGLHLMGGPLTVFDAPEDGGGAAGYVGDALIDDTQADQSRLLTYAIDLAVDADRLEQGSAVRETAITLAAGLLQISVVTARETTYTAKNNSAQPRTLVIEHPHQEEYWALVEPATPAERTAEFYRFDLPLLPGKSSSLSVRQEQPSTRSISLFTVKPDDLLVYARGPLASESVKAALREIITHRTRIAELEASAADLDSQLAAIGKGQERIRLNMQSLDHKTDLYRRYLGELTTQENQIAALTTQRRALADTLLQAQTALRNYVTGLQIA